MSNRPVRVVLVDDHRMFRTGVRAELGELVTEAYRSVAPKRLVAELDAPPGA